MAEAHGGARAGAGRKRLSDRYAEQIAAVEGRIARKARLIKCVRNLQKLADGGYLRVKEEWKPAGLVMVEEQAKQEVEVGGRMVVVPIFNRSGAPVMVKVRAFPGLHPEQLVCVGKVTEIADRDRAANEYLLNRILGKPTQAVELGNGDDGPLKIVVEYADAGSETEDPEAPPGTGLDPEGDAAV